MKLPLLLSVPHAGLWVPPEVESICLLKEADIVEDGDEGAADLFRPLENEVAALVTTRVARAIVDVNRHQDDFEPDGVIKTHTCCNKLIYKDLPSEEIIDQLLNRYYHPYHEALTKRAGVARIGIDCHTMASKGPPVGPDPGRERPAVCLSNADGTCPWSWLYALARILMKRLKHEVFINQPFGGGHIIRAHARHLPWMQLEFSRESFLSIEEKRTRLLQALKEWCAEMFD